MPTVIKSLRSVDSDKAQGILSEVAGALLPNPVATPDWLTEARSKSEADDVRQEVLAEVRQRLKIKPNDQSREANGKLLEYLGTLISSYALDGVDTRSIKQRLGARGDLASDLYEVIINRHVKSRIRAINLSESEVKDVIKYPDDVEHLQNETFASISVYVKHFRSSKTREGYSVIVNTKRNGFVQHVDNAWMVYHSDIVSGAGLTPVGFLRAFAEAYGITLTVGNSTPGRFFVYQAVPLKFTTIDSSQSFHGWHPAENLSTLIFDPTGQTRMETNGQTIRVVASISGDEYEILSFRDTGNYPFAGHCTYVVNPLNVIEIALAYIIDMDLYIKSLSFHGVAVKPFVYASE